MLNEYIKDANGKWIKKGAIGDGSGVSALTGEIHQANGTVLNQSGQRIIDAHAKTVNGMVKDGGQWKSKADLISNGQMQSTAGGSTGSSFGKNVGKTMNANLGTNTQGAANLVKNNISNGERLTNSFRAGRQAGMNSVGLKQGALNTWNKMGKMGKAGVIGGAGAALLGTGYLAMKGLTSSGSKEAAFSEDTNAALKEAAIYGTVGAGILGTGYLAKRGLLGKTAKKTYKSASEKVKTIWNETKKPEIKVGEAQTQQVTQQAAKGKSGQAVEKTKKIIKESGKPEQAIIETTEKIIKESGKPEQVIIGTTAKKVKFAPEVWPKVLKVIKEKGWDSNNPAHKLAAAKIAGVKPVSVK